ncbi:putative pseudouridine synthase II, pseudouridine synthase, catalytic domain superfamily [Septoria linicola]|nr:putative pseudouridine synthase II, pseudouridine synthase, catalytic domain superfamily [Septoria linicola]
MGGRQLLWRSLKQVSSPSSSSTSSLPPSIVTTMSGPILEGVLAINKPPAISSAQVIRDVQNHFNPSKLFRPWLDRERSKLESESHNQKQKRRIKARKLRDVKMGHGGTLDPMATGVLILGIGSGTKDLQYFTTECTKSYEAVVLFGAATDTYDTEGKIVGRKPFDHITREQVEQTLEKFRGKGMQKPPIFSALRVQGKRLYEYAREGKPLPEGFEIQERPVDVTQLELTEWYPGGSHEWNWPSAEADSAEKNLAKQALPGEFGGASPERAGQMEESSEAILKRKRSELDESKAEAAAEPSAKKTKRDAEAVPGSAAPEPMPAAIKRLSTQEGAQPDTETAQAPKDDQQPATSSAEASLPEKSEEPIVNQSRCPAPACRIKMTVTSGFYVRSLIHDLGSAVGSLACMSSLVRTRQSDFELGTNVLQYEELKAGEEVWGPKVQKLLEEWAATKSDRASRSVAEDAKKEET